MFERLLIDNLGEIGFIIGPLVRHNVYKSSDLLKNWSGDQFDNILKSSQLVKILLFQSLDFRKIT